MRRVCLDHNASTPIAPEVAAAMRAAMAGTFGNPSSPHWTGCRRHRLFDQADSVTQFLE